jgi:signal transduction histidine kinase
MGIESVRSCPQRREGGFDLRVALRDQLNVVIGFAELLGEDAGLDSRRRRYAAHIRDAGRRILRLASEDRDRADGLFGDDNRRTLS